MESCVFDLTCLLPYSLGTNLDHCSMNPNFVRAINLEKEAFTFLVSFFLNDHFRIPLLFGQSYQSAITLLGE